MTLAGAAPASAVGLSAPPPQADKAAIRQIEKGVSAALLGCLVVSGLFIINALIFQLLIICAVKFVGRDQPCNSGIEIFRIDLLTRWPSVASRHPANPESAYRTSNRTVGPSHGARLPDEVVNHLRQAPGADANADRVSDFEFLILNLPHRLLP